MAQNVQATQMMTQWLKSQGERLQMFEEEAIENGETFQREVDRIKATAAWASPRAPGPTMEA